MNSIVRHVGGHRWNGVPVLNYKEEGTHFKAISRQVLFEGGPKLGAELRYFEKQYAFFSIVLRSVTYCSLS